MQTDYTHISVILDRSGSMEAIRDDTIGGFNSFLREQQALPGSATLTLVQFDSQDPYEVVHQFRALPSVPALDEAAFVPRGNTPLLDAMGRGISDIDQRLSQLAETARPEKVIVVIITDGQENASTEFSKEQVEKMITDKQQRLGWQFLFLSADLASIALARRMGIGADDVSSFDLSSDGVMGSWHYAAMRSSDYRTRPRPPVAPDTGEDSSS
jgi:Mg-chelatase subunit ChlD